MQMIVTIVGITNSKRDHLLLLVCSEHCYHDPEVFRAIGGNASADTKETQKRLCVWQDKLSSLVLALTSKIAISKKKSHCL